MMTVRDVMTTTVLTARRETPLKDVARLLIDAGISGVPVVDAEGLVCGVVSEADFLVKEGAPGTRPPRVVAGVLGERRVVRERRRKELARVAAQAMTSPAITIRPERSIREAAATMTRHGINRLPVVDDGRLVGIVTRADLVRAYVRTDEELERTILDDVLLKALWLDPAAFRVAVRDGEVSIAGHVERRSTASLVEETVRLVPGVVAVNAEIRWSMDDRDLRPVERDPLFPHGLR